MKIDLTSKSFIPGKKNYERVRTALKERLKQTFDVIVSWDPPGIYIFYVSYIINSNIVL